MKKWSVTGTVSSRTLLTASRTKAADVSSHSRADKQKFYLVGAEIQETRRYVTTTYYSPARPLRGSTSTSRPKG